MNNQLPQVELISSTAQGSVSSFPFSEGLDTGVFVNAKMTLAGIDVNTIDISLIILCPVFTALGCIVASLLKSQESATNVNIVQRFFYGIYANISNLFIGLVLGLVIALFFIGSINNDISSLSRVLVLSVFLGFKAPLLWNLKKIAPKMPAIAKAKVLAPAKAKVSNVTTPPASNVSIDQDALKQERLKKARLKLAAKS
ncbi:MAG: hypothetical protein V7784_13765 [Oceanospirillaceae bacterium]